MSGLQLASPPNLNIAPVLPLPVPWRDPSTVSPELLSEHIATLEQAVRANPDSPDLRTCLGIAYAMAHRVYSCIDALESARETAPDHFWAQFKYAELHMRIRALAKAEQEMLRAVQIASISPEYALAHRHLVQIRALMRVGTQRPAWTKPLRPPAMALAGMILLLVLGELLR